QPLRDVARDLPLLRRQLVDRRPIALAGGLAGRSQLGARPLDPRLGTEALECLEGGTELHACVGAAALPPEVLAVEKVGPRVVERPSHFGKARRSLEVPGRLVAVRE